MISGEQVWHWIAKGLGGACGMLANMHADQQSPRCPAETLAYLERYRDLLSRLIAEQRAEMYVEKHLVSITTAADGSATAYSPVVTGRILGIRYVRPGSSPLDNGADATITLETTGEAILTLTNFGSASASFYPRVPVDDETGADATLDGTRLMRDCVHAANDRVKIVIAQGGNALSGSFYVIVG